MGLSVKAEWVDAYMRAPHRSDSSRERDSLLSMQAAEVLGEFASQHRRAGARLGLSALQRCETDPTLAAAVSELASAGLVRVADAEAIELTARGYDMIQRRVLQLRACALASASSTRSGVKG